MTPPCPGWRSVSIPGGCRPGSGSWSDSDRQGGRSVLDRDRTDEVSGRDIRRCGRTQEGQRKLEFFPEDRDSALDARGATSGQRPQDRPAEQDALCTQRPGDRDIEAATHAAIDPHLGSTLNGADDLSQDINCR